MGDRDRLADLARLVAKLRFAVEGDDRAQIDEAESGGADAGQVPAGGVRRERVAGRGQGPDTTRRELAQLYLERCYKLTDKDNDSLLAVEERIRALLEREESGAP